MDKQIFKIYFFWWKFDNPTQRNLFYNPLSSRDVVLFCPLMAACLINFVISPYPKERQRRPRPEWLTGSFSGEKRHTKPAELPVSHCKWSAVFIGQVSDSYATESIISSLARSLARSIHYCQPADSPWADFCYIECWWHGLHLTNWDGFFIV